MITPPLRYLNDTVRSGDADVVIHSPLTNATSYTSDGIGPGAADANSVTIPIVVPPEQLAAVVSTMVTVPAAVRLTVNVCRNPGVALIWVLVFDDMCLNWKVAGLTGDAP